MYTLPKFEDVPQARQNIDDAQPGHCATYPAAGEKAKQTGRVQFASDEKQEKIIVPIARPGQDQKHDAYLEANQNVNDDSNFGGKVLAHLHTLFLL